MPLIRNPSVTNRWNGHKKCWIQGMQKRTARTRMTRPVSSGQWQQQKKLYTLKTINFAKIQEQFFVPLYKWDTITDALHKVCGFWTGYQFITKSKMRTIQKKVREVNKLLYFVMTAKTAAPQ